MFAQIFTLLLEVVVNLLAGACLLRLYMQYQRVPFQHPLGRFVIAVSNWIVLPLRKVLPRSRIDLASLLGAWLIVLAEFTILWALWGRSGYGVVAMNATFSLIRMAIWGFILMMIVYAIISWVRSESMAYDILDHLCSPLLRPFRRLLPMVGGVDLSPLALLVALQIALILLGGLQQEVLSW